MSCEELGARIPLLPILGVPIGLLDTVTAADCLGQDGLARLADDTADLVLTDPPYNVSEEAEPIGAISVGRWRSDRGATRSIARDFGAWDRGDYDPGYAVPELARVLRPGGSLYLFTSEILYGETRDAAELAGLDIHVPLVWCKTNPPVSFRKVSWRSGQELVLWATKPGARWTLDFGRQTDMLSWHAGPICGPHERCRHPTQKPLWLIERIMHRASRPGDLVVDPFAGSGTTGVAARRLGRRFVLFERDATTAAGARGRLGGALAEEDVGDGGLPLFGGAMRVMFCSDAAAGGGLDGGADGGPDEGPDGGLDEVPGGAGGAVDDPAEDGEL